MSPIDLTAQIILVGAVAWLLWQLRKSRETLDHFKQSHKKLEATVDELSRQNVRLQKEINTDGLTKIGNRAHFEITYKMEWDWALRNKTAFAMLMVDIDHFKRINDDYGHVVGDECLVAVALAIRGCLLRASDRVMRYGGEEFAVLLGGTDTQGVARISERILEAVRSLEFAQGYKITVSIGGGAVYPMAKQKREEFLEKVDEALYCAKRSGRNKYTLVPDSQIQNPPASKTAG